MAATSSRINLATEAAALKIELAHALCNLQNHQPPRQQNRRDDDDDDDNNVVHKSAYDDSTVKNVHNVHNPNVAVVGDGHYQYDHSISTSPTTSTSTSTSFVTRSRNSSSLSQSGGGGGVAAAVPCVAESHSPPPIGPEVYAGSTAISPSLSLSSAASSVLPTSSQQGAPPSLPVATCISTNNNGDSISTSTMSFPCKLYQMLQDVSSHNHNTINNKNYVGANNKGGGVVVVGWQEPDGTSFKVYHPSIFVTDIMPQYFKQTKFKSFQRQLNIYGFRRIHDGPKKGGYAHPNFVRGKTIHLGRVSRLQQQQQQQHQQHQVQQQQSSTSSSSIIKDGTSSHMVTDTTTAVVKSSSSSSCTSPSKRSFCGNDNNINTDSTTTILPSPSTAFTSLLSSSSASPSSSSSLLSSSHIFPFKLYKMLQETSTDDSLSKTVVSWVNDGTAFQVYSSIEFVRTIMPVYFDQTKYESFRRQLNLYGFVRKGRVISLCCTTTSSSTDRCLSSSSSSTSSKNNYAIYSHPTFRRDRPDMLQFVTRN